AAQGRYLHTTDESSTALMDLHPFALVNWQELDVKPVGPRAANLVDPATEAPVVIKVDYMTCSIADAYLTKERSGRQCKDPAFDMRYDDIDVAVRLIRVVAGENHSLDLALAWRGADPNAGN